MRKRDASNGGRERESTVRRHAPGEKTGGAKVKILGSGASPRLYTTDNIKRSRQNKAIGTVVRSDAARTVV